MLDANNQKIIFVDCRSAPECLVSMIPGAISQKEFQSVVVPVLLGTHIHSFVRCLLLLLLVVVALLLLTKVLYDQSFVF